ncbi:hypothetical protein GLOIN_2v1630093 [Rhizophagus irregularis DAOM 181602=DAOM 197198]|uniref:Uncharacterized protein n=1 Tax=Rhizophagus irregularis (strain DAOM 181602 / DAOM 197198 / MUCL 43194) TaxID=747089 RepID=A0A2P4PUR7_RHIID|nr:hypothetical protein GLOIN_2v1630093 [Rhizophagus irregularis DAOM 181602=DAOM 197198]POG69139.1 hypothetical protein GLOIN_2v1630093 [Rhizophagus irregularis DAOM 181602=DAOM 197198]GET62575.1 hypothetical protein GLOIN_2v1630093 [Rhizophagus irregularis DAOM 181602=DAOM 197198]|eukprot:XP_025176005.1 hypothetical protein GLOIN_2v1630093 [Rhizophagus irregularis DAOM 181602=DAOM 197198]
MHRISNSDSGHHVYFHTKYLIVIQLLVIKLRIKVFRSIYFGHSKVLLPKLINLKLAGSFIKSVMHVI